MQKPSAKVDGITISFFYLETSGSQQKQKQEKQNKGYKKCLTIDVGLANGLVITARLASNKILNI